MRKLSQDRNLESAQDGLAYLTLQPDEQIFVNIGGAQVILIGGLVVGAPGERLVVQIVLQEPTVCLEMKHVTSRAGDEYFAVRVVPEPIFRTSPC